MLKSKLYQIEVDKVNKEKDERDSTKLKIDLQIIISPHIIYQYESLQRYLYKTI